MKEGTNQWIGQMIDFIVLTFGLLGMLIGLGSALIIPQYLYFMIVPLLIIGWVLHSTYMNDQKKIRQRFLTIIWIIIFILMLILFIDLQTFIIRLKEVVVRNDFLNFQNIFANLSLFSIVMTFSLGMPIVYFVVSCMNKSRFHFLKIIGIIILFLFPIFIKHKIPIYTAYVFMIYLLYVFVFKNLQQVLMSKILILGLSMVMVICCSIFVDSDSFFQGESTIVNKIIDMIGGNAKKPLVTGMSNDINGLLPTGNMTVNNRVALTIESDTPIATYIRGYSLAYYENNQWKPLEEIPSDKYIAPSYSRYLLKKDSTRSILSMKIKPSKNYDYCFTPYYLLSDDIMQYDSYYENTDDVLRFVDPNQDELSNQLDSSSISYDSNTVYNDFVSRKYLDVDDDLFSTFYSLLERYLEKQGIDFWEMLSDKPVQMNQQYYISLIQDFLKDTTQYTLQCGQLPENQDFVTYFLTVSHKGSCTHYATSGTLLLRSLGIPARFVNGYVVKESDFVGEKAIIRNNRAHAWVEVYINDQGWIPVEMTPSGGSESISDLVDLLDDLEDDRDIPDDDQPTQPQPTTTQQQIEQTETLWYEKIVSVLSEFIYLIIIAFIVLIDRIIVKNWDRWRTKKMNSNQKVIYYYHKIKRIGNNQVTLDDDFIQIYEKARYSQHIIKQEELNFIHDAYQQYKKDVYQKLPFYRRIIFKIIYG